MAKEDQEPELDENRVESQPKAEEEDSDRAEEDVDDNERDIIEPTDFPTLELTLEEARRQYDDEERRRAAVENKIGIVVTVDALLISFGALFGQGLHPLTLVLMLTPALASAGFGLYAIRSRDYERPGKDIWDFHDYSAFGSEDSQREQLLLDYETTTGGNKEKNDPKFGVFNWCITLTFISLVLVLITPVAQHFGLIDWIWNEGTNLIDDFL